MLFVNLVSVTKIILRAAVSVTLPTLRCRVRVVASLIHVNQFNMTNLIELECMPVFD